MMNLMNGFYLSEDQAYAISCGLFGLFLMLIVTGAVQVIAGWAEIHQTRRRVRRAQKGIQI